MKRRELREKIIQALFQVDFTGDDANEALNYLQEENNFDEKEFLFIEKRVNGTLSNLKEIDNEISKYLMDWTIERIPRVDRAILRMSVYEMLFEEEISYKIALNEAIELAKDYSSEESAKFINGVLGSFVKRNSITSDN